jgi:hypothetical protein
MTIVTISYICPMATIFIMIAYVCSYRFYLFKKSKDMLAIKLKYLDVHTKLSTKYSRANENMFEYVIHHEKKKIIDITNELKVEMEKNGLQSIIYTNNYCLNKILLENGVHS